MRCAPRVAGARRRSRGRAPAKLGRGEDVGVAKPARSSDNRRVFDRAEAPYAAPPTAVVVLGCRPGTPAAWRRVAACADLCLRGPVAAEVVLCAGGRAWRGQVEADVFAAELTARGVSAARIVRERCSMTTGENARYAAPLLARRGIARVRLVTCAWHLPRAVAHFRRVGLEVLEVPADAPGGALLRAARWTRERAAIWLDERMS